MVLGTIFTLLYLAVALSAAAMTLWEQRRRQTSFALRLAGFALCLIWPVTVLGMLVAIQWRKTQKRADAGSEPAHSNVAKAH